MTAPLPRYLFARGVLLCRLTPDGIALSDGARSFEGPLSTPGLLALLSDERRVVCFRDAKPAIKNLLIHGLVVKRPVCLTTLARLCGDEPPAPGSAPSLSELSQRTERARREGQLGVARLECLVLPVFAALEHRGLYVDVKGWKKLVQQHTKARDHARQAVFDTLGDAVSRDLFGVPDLNLDADQEVKAVLERVLGHPLDDVGKHTLRRLSHPVTDALLTYREHAKIVSTYGETFLGQVHSDGRIRSTFVPLGASTGRVASRDPNLQNLPSGEAFHQCLCAPEGRKLITADYATCELRILAELSGDEAFLDAFSRGEDLHSVVASRMFDTEVSKEVRPELRARAKAINFGLMYGMGADALGRQVGVSRAQADELLEAYFAAFPRVRRYLEDSVERALQKGYAETVLGRRLSFDAEQLQSDNARGELSRIAKNMPIQGTSADMTKLAMVRVHETLRDKFVDAGLVNTIHDELVVECAAVDADTVGEVVRGEMVAAHETLLRRVPCEVDVHVGDHWMH